MDTKLEPGRVIVLKIVEAGKVAVETAVLIVKLPGSSTINVVVVGG